MPFAWLTAILVGTCNGAPAGASAAPPGGQTGHVVTPARMTKGAHANMQQVSPNSRSLILRATHVLVLQVIDVDERPWTPRAAGGEERAPVLQVRLDEVIKGRIDQTPGQSVRVQARQVRLGEAWGPMPGVWSNVRLDPGLRLVAFSISGSRDAAALLSDPAAVALLPTETALPDVHRVARTAQLGLAGLLAEARKDAPAMGYLFADYLWAKYQAESLADFKSFNAMLTAVEWPELNTVARSTLLMAIPDAVLGVDPPVTRHIDRLAVCMVRLLALPAAKALHDNIVGTFLPNLVDAGNPKSRPPASVFVDYPQDLAQLLQVAKLHAGNDQAAAFLAWAKR